MDGDDNHATRRRLLKAIGTTTLTGFAGCNGLQDAAPGGSDGSPTTESTGTAVGTGTTTPDGADGDASADSGDGGASAGAAGSCPLSLPAEVTEETFEGSVTADTTIGATADRVRVTDDVSVESGATLTVAPGTLVTFAQGSGLSVGPGGALHAAGTCPDPIVFTGDQRTPGYWRGLYFDQSDATGNVLEHVEVSAAGGSAFSRARERAGVAATRGSRLSVSNTTVRNNEGYGMVVGEGTVLDSFERNVLTENALGAVQAVASSVGQLSDSSTYAGNDTDRVYVYANEIPSEADTTWPAIDVRYVVSGVVDLDGHLTVAPGNTVSFEQDGGLRLRTGTSALTAIGVDPATERTMPITFTGEQQTRGFWRGIYIDTADRVKSRFQRVVVEYAGRKEFSRASAKAGVVLTRGSRALFQGCTLRENEGYGFHFGTDVRVDGFVQNTVTANAAGAGYVVASVAHALSDTSTYTGNDTDRVHVDGDEIPADAEVEWDAIDVPYVVADAIDLNGHLTVQPGATLAFGQDSGIEARNGQGVLTAVGIDPDTERSLPITFTGEQQTRGFWRGIHLDETDHTANQLRNCVVEYAGGETVPRADEPAGLVLTRGARVRVDQSTLRENGGYGFHATGDSTVDSFTQNTLTRNEDGACYVDASEAGSLSDTSTYTGNDADRVYVAGDELEDEYEWDALDVAYYVAETVQNRGHVTIEPGATLAFGQDAGFSMRNGAGALTAVGTSDEPIVFTGGQHTRGYWRGLYFDEVNDARNELAHCVVEYGGSEAFSRASDPANVAVTRGARLSVEDCTVRGSGGYGLGRGAGTRVSTSGNAFSNNARGPTVTWG
ncbi:MAG: right-handed parallel beta-helix repeat-containing protein [Haloferacaceae archaeon]